MRGKFYTNKYPLVACIENCGEYEDLPEGNVFVIDSMDGIHFLLKPVSKIDGFIDNFIVTPRMLEAGYTKSEHINLSGNTIDPEKEKQAEKVLEKAGLR